MIYTKYSLGDRVELRTKKSLENEYGVSANGAVKRGFTIEMMPYCGRIGVVSGVMMRIYRITFDVGATPFSYPEEVIRRKV